MRNACRELQAIAAEESDRFLADARTRNSAKYLLIVASEAALDLCNHLAAKKGGRAPEDYADCMTILEEIGVLDADLRGRMSRMARFRNLLVHRTLLSISAPSAAISRPSSSPRRPTRPRASYWTKIRFFPNERGWFFPLGRGGL